MTKQADRVLKMAVAYEKRAELEKRAWVGLLMLALPLVSVLVNQLKQTEEIGADVDKVLSNLNSYKSSYGFGAYDAQFTEFMTACQNLKDSFKAVSGNTDLKDPSLLGNIQKFMTSANKIQTLGFAIKGYLDSMKGAGGKVFDVIKSFQFNLGIDTAATATADAVDSLYKHISMVMPKIESTYKELASKIQDAHQQSGLPAPSSSGTTQKQKTPPANQTEELADITF